MIYVVKFLCIGSHYSYYLVHSANPHLSETGQESKLSDSSISISVPPACSPMNSKPKNELKFVAGL